MTDTRDTAHVATRSDGRIVRRPLSPHFTIYQWPITMIASIANRVSACAISVGALLLVWWLAAAAAGPAAFASAQHFLASPLGLLLLFGWTLALAYHFFAGIRHLAWDAGYGFAHRSLDPVTWITIGASVGSTLLLWILGYWVLGG
jgi:succinate dehydrogenase / fumarate reductase, cytochrome b subunit